MRIPNTRVAFEDLLLLEKINLERAQSNTQRENITNDKASLFC